MNQEQQIEDLQRELIRVERENRILREANRVSGDELRKRSRELSALWIPLVLTLILSWVIGIIFGFLGAGGFTWF